MKRFVRNLSRDFRLHAAIGTVLAVGIGANLAILSVANATLFRKLGVSEPERLFWVKTRFEERGTEGGVSDRSTGEYRPAGPDAARMRGRPTWIPGVESSARIDRTPAAADPY